MISGPSETPPVENLDRCRLGFLVKDKTLRYKDVDEVPPLST